MLSISSVSAMQAVGYYLGKDNLGINAVGEWHGKGADILGLNGMIKEADFRNLLEGKDLEGNQMVHLGIGYHKNERRAGVDLTFSAPKSVSILAEVIGGEIGKDMVKAHDSAVSATLDYIEDKFAQARQYESGRVHRVDTNNLAIAVFQHNLSREFDPQLHTHAVVINQTVRADGKTVAVEYKEIFDNKLFLGQVYRNEIAGNLASLDYGISSNEKGLFEVKGVEQTLINTFSKRSAQIEAALDNINEVGLYRNVSESKRREIAGLESRARKIDATMDAIREGWDAQLKDLGFNKDKIINDIEVGANLITQDKLQQIDPSSNEYDYLRLAADHITQQDKSFSKEDLLRTAGALSIGEYRVVELEKGFHELTHDTEFVAIDEKHMYTTRERYHMESQTLENASEGKAEPYEEKCNSDDGARSHVNDKGEPPFESISEPEQGGQGKNKEIHVDEIYYGVHAREEEKDIEQEREMGGI